MRICRRCRIFTALLSCFSSVGAFSDLFQPQIHHHLLHPQGAKAQFIHLVNILKIDINQPIEALSAA